MSHNAIKKFYALPFNLQLLVLGLLSASIVYASYQWCLAPLNLDFEKLQNEGTSLKYSLETLIQQKTRTSKAIAQRSALQQKLDYLNQTMALHADSSALLNDLLTKGNHNQLYFRLFDPVSQTAEKGYKKITLKIVAVGSYHHLASFLSEIANMPHLIVIDQFSISKEKIESRLTAELVLKLFLNPKLNTPHDKDTVTLNYAATRSPSMVYQADHLRSPFQTSVAPIQHHALSNKLQTYPVSTLRLGGTVTQAGTASVAYILTPDNDMYQVKEGDKIGDHHGKITNLQRDRIVITELNTDQTLHIVTIQLAPTLK